MRKYQAYKETGAAWLSMAPKEWGVKRFKFTVSLINEKTSYLEVDLPYIGLENIESWTGRYLPNEEPSAEGQVSLFQEDDVLFGKLRPYLAKIHLANFSGAASTEALVLRTKEELLPEFLRYFLVAPDSIENINSSTFGSKMPRASWEFIGNQIQLIPSLPEQRAIADFLDKKVAHIDGLIGKKRRLLELRAEKRAALITNAVTKGLDPTAKMKPSGIDWLGDIPEGWEVQRLKMIANVRGGITKGRKVTQPTFATPYLRVANVQDGWLDLEEISMIDATLQEIERYSLQSGDILMNEGGDLDKLGRGTIWRDEIEGCIHQNHVFCVRSIDIESEWIQLAIRSDYSKTYFLNYGKQTTNLASISSANLSRLPVPLPPENERKEIIRFVRDEDDHFGQITNKLEDAISTLEEYRAALITAAVTGKIKVA